MNIKEAKLEISNTIRLYLEKTNPESISFPLSDNAPFFSLVPQVWVKLLSWNR